MTGHREPVARRILNPPEISVYGISVYRILYTMILFFYFWLGSLPGTFEMKQYSPAVNIATVMVTLWIVIRATMSVTRRAQFYPVGFPQCLPVVSIAALYFLFCLWVLLIVAHFGDSLGIREAFGASNLFVVGSLNGPLVFSILTVEIGIAYSKLDSEFLKNPDHWESRTGFAIDRAIKTIENNAAIFWTLLAITVLCWIVLVLCWIVLELAYVAMGSGH